MPLVIVTSKLSNLSRNARVGVGVTLQVIVSEGLDVFGDKNARLTPDDIEIRFRHTEPQDINASDLAIEIFASDYPGRRENLQERTERMAEQIRGIQYEGKYVVPRSMLGKKNFLWVLLAPAGFVIL